jgi:hypothetical protein
VSSYVNNVKYLKNLFCHHRPAGGAAPASDLVNWAGQSGKEYPYTIYALDTQFQMTPGNFIYARQAEEGSWVPIYITQTRNLGQRLEGHVTVQDAIQNGATHIHAHYDTAGQAARCGEERDLLWRWKPVCNESTA